MNTFTAHEIDDVIKSLAVVKASGVDTCNKLVAEHLNYARSRLPIMLPIVLMLLLFVVIYPVDI